MDFLGTLFILGGLSFVTYASLYEAYTTKQKCDNLKRRRDYLKDQPVLAADYHQISDHVYKNKKVSLKAREPPNLVMVSGTIEGKVDFASYKKNKYAVKQKYKLMSDGIF